VFSHSVSWKEGFKEVIEQRYGEFWEDAFKATDKLHDGKYTEACRDLAKAPKDLSTDIKDSLKEPFSA
jgi:hypothetical protein